MIHPPFWLTNDEWDEIREDEYDLLRLEFMDALKHEEEKLAVPTALLPANQPLSAIMQRAWDMGTIWFNLALETPLETNRIFYYHIQPRLAAAHGQDPKFREIMQCY
ncbi:hypothetical protein A1O3_10053 [Capronia epimyces CBS 606.96]|uniref:Uncharacterized protein n=1 Tax=Capronia epimyces CBS 606.96 TaxID=1182542 RepID=W9XIX7_9EURO|nr:uncharacterized protein A1O3_10053 [Capronia epimyces CBS 606.96]EXJ76896.1 hypothetical protein A1O3_10053 [Capronia epimyces CBS 606.96]